MRTHFLRSVRGPQWAVSALATRILAPGVWHLGCIDRCMGAQSHRELAAWKLSDEVRRSLIRVCGREPVRSDRAFCGQALSAAGSACRNIAEGFARYRHADFARFVTMAYASLVELEDILDEGHERGYVTAGEYDAVLTQLLRAKRASNGLRRYLHNTPTPAEHLRTRTR